MKRIILLFAAILFSSAVAVVIAQKSEYVNGTEQIGNHNFETFINLGGESEVPLNWSSFMTATGSQSGMVKSQQVWRSTEKRPGTTGQYSVKIGSRNAAFGIIANGNLTTGRVNAGSMTATSCDNHNYTERGNPTYSHPFTSVPDSVVVWVKSNAAGRGGFEVIIHNDNNTKAPCTEGSQIVAYANPKFDKNGSAWQRLSQAFDKNRASKDPRYCLINAATNEQPSGGSTSDEVWFDDLLFVYNPTLTLGEVPLTIGLLSEQAYTFNVPYILTGTMNPYNNLPDNKIIVELSDANGSFANPRVIGEVTAFESGTVPCSIPYDIERGSGYRIRVRSTNYPMVTPDNGRNIEIFSAFMVNAVPSNHRGIVSGNKGAQKQNSTVSLSARANQGNIFTHWSENGNTLADVNANYTFVLDRDRNLIAHFDTSSYQFTLTITTGGELGESGGSVSGSTAGKYIHNSVISLNAVAEIGYDFSGYFENNIQISSSTDFSFQITKDRNIEARFTPRKYLVNLSSNNSLYGSVSGGGLQNYNSVISLSAIANPYCEFIAWVSNGDTLGKLPVLDYTVKNSVSITAIFAEIRYPVVVSVNPAVGGTVSGAGTYSAFNANTTVTLRATAAVGYDFKRFTDDNTLQSFTQNPFVLLSGSRLTSAKSFTAYFELKNYNIFAGVLPSGAGMVDGSGIVAGAGVFAHGTNVSLNAVAAEGYEFVAWLHGTSDTASKSSQISFVAGRDTALNALFRLKRYNISVESNDNSYGNVSGSGIYEHFSQVPLIATANEGYEFRYWRIDGNIIDSVSPLNYSVTGEANIEAVFSIIRKNITAKVLPVVAGEVHGTGRYEHSAQVSLTAEANKGYRFIAWEDTFGNRLDIAPTVRFNALKDSCLVARFEAIPYRITMLSSSVDGYGELSFDGINYSSSTIDSLIPYGTTLPLYASVTESGIAEGYKFTGWKNSVTDALLSVEDTFYYTVRQDESLLASFSNNAVSITVSAQPSDAGIIEGDGNYEEGSWYPVRAIPNYGYRVKEWQTAGLGIKVETADLLMVYAEKDTSFVVIFEKDSFNVNVDVLPLQAGEVAVLDASSAGVSSAGVSSAGASLRYCYEDTAVLTARSNDNYHFLGWSENGIMFSTYTEIKIEINRAYNITALFDSNEVSLTVISSHPDNSSVSASVQSKYGRSETLIAVAGEGIHFIGWKYGSDTLSGDTLYMLMQGDCTVTALFDTNRYNLSLATLPGGCVDIIIGTSELPCTSDYAEELYYNTVIKIVAVADYGYHASFDTLSFIIKKDTNISVEFFRNNVTVQASCNALQGYTSVSGGAGVGINQLYGDEVLVEAVAYNGYNFVKWTLASDTSILFSTYPMVSFIAVSDTNLVAHFERVKVDVFVESNNESAGYVSFGEGSGLTQEDTTVDFGSTVTVVAYPLYGYHFSYWEADGMTVSTDNIYQVPEITGTRTLVAVFEGNSYRVELLPQPEICGEALGSGIYPYGSTIEIRGVAETNFFFDRWLSGASGSQEFVSFDSVYSFVLTRDTVFTAVFRTDTFNIGVDVATVGGTASGGGRFLLGQEVNITAESNYGYVFSEWQNNSGTTVSRENPYMFNASENISLRAVFVPQTFNVKINSNAGSSADIRGAGNYRYGDDAYLLALSDDIYTFNYWELSEEVAQDSIFTAEELLNNVLFYPVEKDLEIRAVYQIREYMVSAVASPIMGGTVSNTGIYSHGSGVTLEATAAAHYHFVNWVYNGVVLSENRQLQIDSLSRDMELIATFAIDRHNITLTCTPSAGGVLNGGGEYSYGDTATLSVSLNPGYTFRDWLDRDFKPVGNDTTIKYIVTGDNYITARLTKETSTESISLNERVSIYPNPVSSLLYVDGAFVSAGVFDFAGREVMRSGSSPIDVSSLKAGVYVLRIEFSDGAVLIKKLVVN